MGVVHAAPRGAACYIYIYIYILYIFVIHFNILFCLLCFSNRSVQPGCSSSSVKPARLFCQVCETRLFQCLVIAKAQLSPLLYARMWCNAWMLSCVFCNLGLWQRPIVPKGELHIQWCVFLCVCVLFVVGLLIFWCIKLIGWWVACCLWVIS